MNAYASYGVLKAEFSIDTEMQLEVHSTTSQ